MGFTIFGFVENFRKWINILLGNSETRKRFVGGSVVNGHPTDQFKILRGRRQVDPFVGYLFVICIEILALTIQLSKTIPYKTKRGNKKLNDTYTDDITLYLKYFTLNENANKINLKYALDCFDLFSTWSGLNINKKKTYINIFGQNEPEPSFVKSLNYCSIFFKLFLKIYPPSLNYCSKLTLLGTTNDYTLMMTDYDEGLRKLEIVANDW